MKKLFIIAALGALVLTACKEKEQLLKEIEYAVTLDIDNLVIPVGVEVQLNAAVLPEDADKPVVWLSNKPDIASVSDNGLVTGHANGDAVILAVVGDGSAVCRVNVFRPITELSLDSEPIQILRKETFLLKPQFLPDDATEIIKWSSSDLSVASVDEDGVVTGVGEGQAVITAKCYYTSAECTVEVSEIHATAISLSGPSEIWLGYEEPITATLTPSNSTDDIEWSSSAPEVASVDKNGVVKGLALGNADISASIGELTTSMQVEVIAVPVKEIVLTPNPIVLSELGQSVQVTATILPEDAADKSLEWGVDDPAVVSIDENGNVTALGTGETHIYATAANGVVGNAAVKVTLPLSLPYTEDFESYDNESIGKDWYFFDVDGDGHLWRHNQPDYSTFGCHSGTGILSSSSYDNPTYTALTPDNWAFTPAIKLEESDNVLSFWLAPQDGSYPKEHYAVYISTEVSTEGCTRLVEGTLTEGTSYIYEKPSTTGAPASGQYKPMDVGTWESFTVPIPDEFNGKIVHIAFRHYNCTDMFWLNLDDISITSSASEAPVDPEPEEPAPASYRAPRMSFPGNYPYKIVR